MRFALNNKDFDSAHTGTLKSGKSLELTKTGKDEYLLLEHIGDNVGEIYTFTKQELLALWAILTEE